MAEFVLTSVNKTAVRKLDAPIADAAAFSGIIESILADNPWDCTPWEGVGVAHDGVEKVREAYTTRIEYEHGPGRTAGTASARTSSLERFTAARTTLLDNTVLESALGGRAGADPARETYACRLRCHDANGEIYSVAFTRTSVRVSGFEDIEILRGIEAWADDVPALA
ncbi:hypothetical protein J2129_000040 [Methanofollis sp. W23]|uniref:hypothetical protein n=1 Tax=Methanofollis sp. W23 TaxID=2817849 RepID=UPI001AE6ED32|nr:hypothetical protein [Methanofollis sp. W23]MBP2144586.1 hypothetical protein [Methanofollis sp. W23]